MKSQARLSKRSYEEPQDQQAEAGEAEARSCDRDLVAPPGDRLSRLIGHLLSPSVRVDLPAEAAEEPARLTAKEVEKVFVERVPGVEAFLYRQTPGQTSLKFIATAYRSGLKAFEGTDIHNHLLWLMRLIVHHGCSDGAGSAGYLRDVAEAFMDCQAVQARVIERVGLEIRGVQSDFRGLITRLVGDYKAMALKILTFELLPGRDGNPTHYENRLTADLGEALGLNMDDIRRAELDEHARMRHSPLPPQSRLVYAARCRELFDIGALLQAITAEVNGFSEASLGDSLPRLFLDWASQRMRQKHVVFDEATSMRVDIDKSFAMATLEVVFLGQPAEAEEAYRGHRLGDLFLPGEHA
jgi:hypothetical protein